jgi:hypothetical protein
VNQVEEFLEEITLSMTSELKSLSLSLSNALVVDPSKAQRIGKN